MPREVNPRFRRAAPGELCPCGRQARVVYRSLNGSELGYCGLQHSEVDTSGPCPFCGGKWPTFGICTLYQLRPVVTPRAPQASDDQTSKHVSESSESSESDEREEGR